MSESRNFVEVDPPNSISFNYQPKKYLVTNLKLKNITNQYVAFKIKTNAPVSYLVKPHSGYIAPGRVIEITVTMQPTDYNPQNSSLKDKFLINALVLPDGADLNNYAKYMEGASDSQFQAKKLPVVLKYDTSNTQMSSTDFTRSGSVTTIEDKEKTFGSSSINEQRDNITRINNLTSSTFSTQGEEPTVGKNMYASMYSSQISGEHVESDLQRALKAVTTKNTNLEAELFSKQKERNELVGKLEQQKVLIFEITEEKNKLKAELEALKANAFKPQASTSSNETAPNTYQLWHLIMAAIIGLVLGAFLRAD